MKPICMVIGAGAGIGGNVGKRFAREGYHAVLCRRSDEAGLRKMLESIEGEGGLASGFWDIPKRSYTSYRSLPSRRGRPRGSRRPSTPPFSASRVG